MDNTTADVYGALMLQVQKTRTGPPSPSASYGELILPTLAVGVLPPPPPAKPDSVFLDLLRRLQGLRERWPLKRLSRLTPPHTTPCTFSLKLAALPASGSLRVLLGMCKEEEEDGLQLSTTVSSSLPADPQF